VNICLSDTQLGSLLDWEYIYYTLPSTNMDCWIFGRRSNCLPKVATGVDSTFSTGKGKSQLSPNKVVHGFSLVKGKSTHPMEDYHVAEFRKVRGLELGLYAIFDGHLGENVASYLQKNLFRNILSEDEFWSEPCFKYLSLWAVGTFHSTATLSIQRVPAVCMGSGSCTVSIFSVRLACL